jgi:hypothetical protein
MGTAAKKEEVVIDNTISIVECTNLLEFLGLCVCHLEHLHKMFQKLQKHCIPTSMTSLSIIQVVQGEIQDLE